MNIKDLSKIQIVILLLIAGFVSINTLNALSQYHRDYYVSAALSQSFFITILLLVLTSPFLYIFRKKEKKETPNRELIPIFRIGWKKIFIAVLVILGFGILIGVFSYTQTRLQSNTNNVVSNICPQIPIKNLQVQKLSKVFDPYSKSEGENFYPPNKLNPWSTINMIDVDGDGIPESIKTANIAMNHTPHLLKIIKNDDTVIFEAEGAGIDIEETGRERTTHENGFYLLETLDWNNNLIKRTKYIYQNGGFIPEWYQESKNCNFK